MYSSLGYSKTFHAFATPLRCKADRETGAAAHDLIFASATISSLRASTYIFFFSIFLNQRTPTFCTNLDDEARVGIGVKRSSIGSRLRRFVAHPRRTRRCASYAATGRHSLLQITGASLSEF